MVVWDFFASQGLHGCVISSFAMSFVSKWYPKSMSTFETTWSFPRSLRSRRFLKGKHWRRMEFPSILKNTIGICAAVPFLYCWYSVYIYIEILCIYLYIYTTHIYLIPFEYYEETSEHNKPEVLISHIGEFCEICKELAVRILWIHKNPKERYSVDGSQILHCLG